VSTAPSTVAIRGNQCGRTRELGIGRCAVGTVFSMCAGLQRSENGARPPAVADG
jgi:hypothetical protein